MKKFVSEVLSIIELNRFALNFTKDKATMVNDYSFIIFLVLSLTAVLADAPCLQLVFSLLLVVELLQCFQSTGVTKMPKY